MPSQTARELKKVLFDAYGGFADKRVRNLDTGNRFIVDDRGPGDFDARKQLFLWFCQIFVDVLGPASIKVVLRGDVPTSPSVREWLAAHGAQQSNFGIEFTIQPGQLEDLRDLANRIARIVAPGNRYEVPSYKYVCPRTAGSLMHLQSVLQKAWA
jgi:hypothetical protein